MIFAQVNEVSFSSGKEDQNYLAIFTCTLSDIMVYRNKIGRGKKTYLFRGWKAAEVTGASNRIVVTRLGGSVSEAKSQMMTFQSFDEVKTYLELRLQLHCKETKMKNKQTIRTHDQGLLETVVVPLCKGAM